MDTLGYVSARLDPAQRRRARVWIDRKLKRGKAFEASKLKGLLVVNHGLDWSHRRRKTRGVDEAECQRIRRAEPPASAQPA